MPACLYTASFPLPLSCASNVRKGKPPGSEPNDLFGWLFALSLQLQHQQQQWQQHDPMASLARPFSHQSTASPLSSCYDTEQASCSLISLQASEPPKRKTLRGKGTATESISSLHPILTPTILVTTVLNLPKLASLLLLINASQQPMGASCILPDPTIHQ